MRSEKEKSALHNKLAGEIVRAMTKPVIDVGGTWSEILVVLESVSTGVLAVCAKLEGWDTLEREAYLRAMVSGIRMRLEKLDRDLMNKEEMR